MERKEQVTQEATDKTDPATRTRTVSRTEVSQHFKDFWSDELKKGIWKWTKRVIFAILVIGALLMFYKLVTGWNPFTNNETTSSMVSGGTTTSTANEIIEEEPACRPRGSYRLCLPDTTSNARIGFGDTIEVNRAALPVKTILCERSDTTFASKITCRPFEVHK